MITVYSASAGSGKTYTLTREYLQLALGRNYKTAYRHILAVTFTNKATREMKSRILRELSEISKGKISSLTTSLCETLSETPEVLQHRAGAVLSAILHDYASFSISTIDAFFQKLVRNFTREAGLQGGYKIELDPNAVLNQVTEQVLSHLGQNGYEELDQWVLRMAEEKIEKGEKWDFRQEMIGLGKELFKETLMRREEDLEGLSANSDLFKSQRKKLFQDLAIHQGFIKDYVTEKLNDMSKNGITPEQFSFAGKGSLADYLIKVQNGLEELPGTRASQMLSDSEKCFAKNNTNRKNMIPLMDAKFLPDIRTFIDELEERLPTIITLQEIKKYFNILGLVSFIREELKVYREHENVLLLPDTTLLLYKLVRENDASFIFEKAGNYFNHFLIDEFQDTSHTQWENFKPLLLNSLATGNKNLIVGDIKQSIYRWRDGDWRLLYGQFSQGIHETQIQKKNLNYNYRSLPIIIEGNNAIFRNMPNAGRQMLEGLIPDNIQQKSEWLNQITGLFETAEQEIPEEKKNINQGYIEINAIPKVKTPETVEEDEEDLIGDEDIRLTLLYNQIEQLTTLGHNYRDMAIITRTRGQGSKILNFLMSGEHGRKIIPVSSSEALSIGSGLSVQLIIHALTIILSDNNAPAKAALSYQLSDKSTDGIWSKAWINKTPLNIPEAFLNEKSRSELRKIPLFELVHVIIRQLCLDQPEWEAETGFITGFLDGILEFMKEDNPDAERFLDWWETTGKTRAVMMPDENDTIRILTIHKSKGLEFPIVFVPFCDWSILPGAQNSPWIWCNPNQHKINPLKLAPIKFGKRMEQSVFAHSYYEEIQLNYADTLNLLYVAFTRAVKGLFITFQVQENQSGLSQGKSSTLILKTIENSIFQASPENPNKFTLGDILSLEKEPIKIEQNTQALQLHSENWMDRLRVKKIARKLPAYSSAKSKTEYGIFIHAVLEKIRYQEDAERVIRELMYSGYIPESEVENILNKLNQIFADPIAGKWFQKPIRCKNEASILSPDGKISRPDRIMFDQDKIILVDFKTGKRKPEDIEQLKSYTILLSEMNYKNIEAWLLYLNEDKIELKAIE